MTRNFAERLGNVLEEMKYAADCGEFSIQA
jgi:hypothetical protein